MATNHQTSQQHERIIQVLQMQFSLSTFVMGTWEEVLLNWVFHTNRVQPPIQSPINISKYLDLANETSVHANIKIYNRWGCTRWGGVRPLPGSSRLLSSRWRWPLLAIFCLLPCPLLFPFSDPDCSMTSISSLPRNISKLQFAVLAITK